jgi:phosphatidylglycerol:prolipoprotein diacylglycerol transferase
MIPYIRVPDLTLGSSPIHVFGQTFAPPALHPFGILVASAVVLGTSLALRRGRKLGYDLELLNSFITWMLLFGFVLSHMLDQIFYHPEEIVRRPISLIMVHEGLSSFGGFVGATIGVFVWKYFRWAPLFSVGGVSFSFFRRRETSVPLLPFIDVIQAIFPTAWILGRSGCSVVHDHPGARAPEGAFLAIDWPVPGEHARTVSLGPIDFVWGSVPRWDLGFLELVFTIFVAVCFMLTWRKKLPIGMYVVVVSLAYAPVRFCMDFLRITEGEAADRRYGQLTFAQWLCVGLFLFGFALWAYVRRIEKKGIDLAAPVRVRPEAPAPPSDALPA